MKKIFSYFTILLCFLILGNVKDVYAVEINSDDITNSTYVIGKAMFTRDVSDSYSGSLSTDVIMLAAKTIDSNKLEDMIIYYKNARGVWVNALTNETIEVPEKFIIEYKNNVLYVETPTLSIGSGGMDGIVKHVNLTIGIYGYYTTEETIASISGWELYEKNNDEYILVAGDDAEVDIGETKTYVARAYTLDEDNEKVYSAYSNEVVIDNSEVKTPTLNNITLTACGEDCDPEEFVSTLVDGRYMYDLGINKTLYRVDGDIYLATGYVIYEKTSSGYVEVEDYEMTGSDVVTVDVEPGQKKQYVARVYALNKVNNRVYSECSNVITIDHTVIETPTLTSGTGGMNGVVKYVNLTIHAEGYYTTEDTIASISGWELYEKNDDEYILVDGYDAEADIGETKTFVARAYALNQDNEKVYSAYSNEFEIDNSEVETPTLRNDTVEGWNSQFEEEYIPTLTDGKYMYDLGINKTSYVVSEDVYLVTGYVVYEKTDDGYVEIEDYEMTGSDVVIVNVEPGQKKQYVARVYGLNKANNKVYSEYSNVITIDHTVIEAPVLRNDTIEVWNSQFEEEYVSTLTDGKYLYDLAINKSEYGSRISVDYAEYSISGYVIYEKTTEGYEVVQDIKIDGADVIMVELEPGQKKQYVARVYAEDIEGEKHYSEYSNIVTIDHAND